MQTTRIWLASIIVLTVLAFLVVFRPVTFTPRKDPIDSAKYLLPAGVTQADLSLAPSPSFIVPNTRVGMYFYKPQSDLALDLDLRGGMRVSLQIPDRADMRYQLTPELTNNDEASKKQAELIAALAAPDALGAEESAKGSITVSPQEIHVITLPDNQVIAQNQFTKVTQVVTKVFGDGKFTTPKSTDIYKPVDANTQKTILQIMEKRLNPTGTTEVRSYAEGTNRVVLEIPGVKDPEMVKRLLRTTAKMEFRLVPKNIMVSNNDQTGAVTATDNLGKDVPIDEVINKSTVELTGSDLKPESDVTTDGKSGKPAIAFRLVPSAAHKFEVLTATNVNRQLAIVLDKKIQMAPSIKDKISGGNGIITGNYTFEEAKTWANLLNAGAMPVPVQIMETRLMSATLGQDSVSLSLTAGLIGLGLVLIFMGFYYRLPGIMANIALIIYIFLTLAVLKITEVVLSLPGIAGIIISIGMAVDANVIIFERLKEELRTQKPLDTAIDVAFSRAWTAILDSNVASLITGSVLYAFGSGAIRGFAVTLIIGVVVSLFTAITVTRLFLKLMIRSKAGHKLSWYGV
ncbi:MAG TPA: protein translocase subunit SecD [Armatimonadota bacterium]